MKKIITLLTLNTIMNLSAQQMHPVQYTRNDGISIAANVYTPAGYDNTKKYPAIVVAHPNGGVKEQVAGLYAELLAKQGYIVIAPDAAYQGASGGTPRNVDTPSSRTADLHAAADFISTYAGVDANRIGILGICGGGGYTLNAAKTDKRFKAVATLSMFNTGLVRRNGFKNSQVATIQQRLKEASEAREEEARGGQVRYVGNMPKMSKEEVAKMPFELYREGYEYYLETHAHPNSTFRYTQSSLLDLMRFDATDQIELINQPLLMLAGSKADTRDMTEDAFAKAVNAQAKELYLLEGATHIQTYWKEPYVTQAVKKLTEFFKKNL
ncbi:x-Pro dipeptidyl-peptidase [Capnocytophaga sp. oral taxon 863 str. F0517]|uniref:alpha/beta hydrolase n=1 Tax=Capnocytophaga sp. oral taxon 863 TaxID=1227265 RepID=UPI0003960219|nr:alpha/beta hydrolase [Capnocytophaga sp. oral taxon 863]ERI63760.1 x-Pro dipeptidyl-peptidase [Capnocytophaga sp. oral taxon 863 str. F0517]